MHKYEAVTAAVPWIDRTAQRIADPVGRLRFLRAVVPEWPPAPQPTPSRRSRMVYVAGLLTSLPVLLIVGRLAITRLSAATAGNSSIPLSAVESSANSAEAISIPSGLALPRADSAPKVWQVETTPAFETYSNALRIENRFCVANHPRSYHVFAANGELPGERRNVPAGIVYHTTESLQAPFEASQNGKLKQVGESLLEYVQRRRAYNFVIDRFGRVYRVVQETDAAEHAGYSVWADAKWRYVNLNESFIGVSLETETQPGQVEATVTAAQIRAVAMLTEMLRSRYGIAAENCVTHAQVSVSPARMLAGYHMDWGSSFPFEAIGLPDNYAHALPAIAVFGFDRDAGYARMAGPRLADGAALGEKQLAEAASAAGMSVQAYRRKLQARYRRYAEK